MELRVSSKELASSKLVYVTVFVLCLFGAKCSLQQRREKHDRTVSDSPATLLVNLAGFSVSRIATFQLSYLEEENPLMASENPSEAYGNTFVASFASMKMVRRILNACT